MFDEYTRRRLPFATHFRCTLCKEIATANWLKDVWNAISSIFVSILLQINNYVLRSLLARYSRTWSMVFWLVSFYSSIFFLFFFVRPNGRWDRRGRSPLAWRGLQPSTALLATGQSLCQVSTYRSTWIFSGLRWNDKLCLLFLCFDDLVASWNTIPDVSSPSRSSDWLQPLHPFRQISTSNRPMNDACFRFIDQSVPAERQGLPPCALNHVQLFWSINALIAAPNFIYFAYGPQSADFLICFKLECFSGLVWSCDDG